MDKDTSGPEGPSPPRKPRRRSVTIDLPAEEISRKPSPAAPADPPAPPAEATADASAEAPTTSAAKTRSSAESEREIGGADGEAPHPSSDSDPRGRPSPRGGRDFIPLAAASLAGGALVALAMILLIAGGYIRPAGEDASAEIASLRAEIAGLREAAADALAPLRDEVVALERSLAEVAAREPPAPDAAALQDIEARLAEIERLAQSGTGVAGTALEARLDTLADEVAALRSAEAASADAGPAIEALAARLDTLPSRERIDALEARLDDVAGQISLAAALGPAVAAEGLRAALEAGESFTAELSALRALGVDLAALDALGPHAEAGLPTIAELRSGFETTIASSDLSAPVDDSAGPLDRLLQSARGLVEVRPARPTAGTDPAAVVARIRGALADGNLGVALAEWASLPDGIKAATEEWQRSAELRRQADGLVATLRADALARLRPPE